MVFLRLASRVLILAKMKLPLKPSVKRNAPPAIRLRAPYLQHSAQICGRDTLWLRSYRTRIFVHPGWIAHAQAALSNLAFIRPPRVFGDHYARDSREFQSVYPFFGFLFKGNVSRLHDRAPAIDVLYVAHLCGALVVLIAACVAQ